jgi:hypothetical protein
VPINGANLVYYSDAAHTQLLTHDDIVCGSNGPSEPWWSCGYSGVDYIYIYNSGNEPVKLTGTTVSEPAVMSVAYDTGYTLPYSLAPAAITPHAVPWANNAVAPPASCVKGQLTYPGWLQMNTDPTQHVCSNPLLSVPVQGTAGGTCP